VTGSHRGEAVKPIAIAIGTVLIAPDDSWLWMALVACRVRMGEADCRFGVVC